MDTAHRLSRIFTITLTIFAMLFGAGNLIFPIRVGMLSGDMTLLGFLGFALTGVVLPVIGLMAIVAFEGDYNAFFGRLGDRLGKLFVFICMLVIGPALAMPRIVMLSYEMAHPFMPTSWGPTVFALLFSLLVFIATFRPGRLLDIIGKFLSPLKIISIATIIIIGIVTGSYTPETTDSALTVFSQAFGFGYETLDMLGSLFFGSIILTLMTKYSSGERNLSSGEAVSIAGIAGACAAVLLGFVYLGMTYLGAYHGYNLAGLNEGTVFSTISFRLMGTWGAAFMAATVCLACFVTVVSLTAVVSEYVQVRCGKRLSYVQAVVLVLAATTYVASFGLGEIIQKSQPFIMLFYPLVIVITVCNLLYKLVGFSWIRLPVAAAAVAWCCYMVDPIYTSIASVVGGVV